MARYTKVLNSLAHNAVGKRRIKAESSSGGISALNWDAANYRYTATNSGGGTINGTSAQNFGVELLLGGTGMAKGMLTLRGPDNTKRVSFAVQDAHDEQQTYQLPLDFPSTSGYALVSTDAGIMSWAAFSGGNSYITGLAFAPSTQKLTATLSDSSTVLSNTLTNFGNEIYVSGSNAGRVRFYEPTSAGSNYLQLQAPATIASDFLLQLPNSLPAGSGYALVSTTAGVMSWAPNSDANYYVTGGTYSAGSIAFSGTTSFPAFSVTGIPTGTPAGSNTQLQYNNGGAFGGVDDWTWNGTDMTIATGSKLIFGDANRYIDEDGAHLRIRNSETGGNIDLNAKNSFRFYIDGAQKMSISSAGNATFTSAVTLGDNSVTNTQTAGNNTTRIATTAFVAAAVAASSGTPAGSNKQIQFNNSSAFGGSKLLYETTGTNNAKVATTGSLYLYAGDNFHINSADAILFEPDEADQSGGDLKIYNYRGGTQYSTFDGSTQRVGIGTTAPSFKLEVAASDGFAGYFRGTSTATIASDTTNNNYLRVKNASIVDATTALLGYQTGNGYIGGIVGIEQYDADDGNNVYANLVFGTKEAADSSPNRRMTILHNGNVGIGTATPLYPLQVMGAIALGVAGNSYTGDRIKGATGKVQIVANGGTQATFDGTGLGLGTTAPGKKLHVQGDIAVSGASTAGDAGKGHSLFMYNQTGTQVLEMYADSRGVSGGKALDMNVSGRLNISSTEHMGIGPSSSGEYLHLFSGPTAHMYFDAGDSFLFRDKDDSSAIRARLYTASGRFILNDSTPATQIDLNPEGVSYIAGNFGVGLGNPQSFSDRFSAQIGSNSGWPIGFTNAAEDVKGGIRTDQGDNYVAFASKSASDIRFFYNDAEANTALIIKGAGASAGNVGIGHTAPTRTLDVRGRSFVSGATDLVPFEVYAYGAGTSALHITSGSDTGIGTATPLAKVHINAGAYQQVFQRDTHHMTIVKGNSDDRLIFATGAPGSHTTRFSILSTGINVVNDAVITGSMGVGGLITASGGVTLPATSDNFTMGSHAVNDILIDGDSYPGSSQDSYLITAKYLNTVSGAIVAAGGGGTIGGSITDNQIAFGATTANSIEGSNNLTFDGNHLKLLDDKKAIFGTGDDLQIYHNGSNSYLDNQTGDFRIQNYASDKDIIFKIKDNTTETEVMRIDGSTSRVGIGTTAPNNTLEVAGVIRGTNYIWQKQDGSPGILVGNGGNADIYYDGTDLNINAARGGSGILKIATNTTVTGVLSATAKSFNIPHPLYKDKRLVHGSLEGPEHAIYVRGTIETEEKGCLVELPEYWSAMCEDYTVQLTPHGPYTVYIKEKLKDKVMIECSQNKFKFDYYIVGARTDETLEVVQDASSN